MEIFPVTSSHKLLSLSEDGWVVNQNDNVNWEPQIINTFKTALYSFSFYDCDDEFVE